MTDFNYTVKQNDSLSKIFLEQAKLKDSSLDSKKIDWNKVINVFEEIQAEEAKEGQRIYRSNPNVIWSGDTISLSENQMNRIYEAMGLEISPAEDPPASGGVDDPENPQAPQESNLPKDDPNPPVNPPNTLIDPKLLPQEVSPLDITSTMFRLDLAGKEYKDVLTGSRYVYDENGYVTDIYDANGNNTRRILRSTDGTPSCFYDYEYDAKGNRTRQIYRSNDGIVKYYSDYEYDTNGNQTRSIARKAHGNILSYIDYEYDANNNLTREICRNDDGSVSYYTDYEYDGNGTRTVVAYDSEGSIKSTYEETLVNGEWQYKDE